MANRKQLYNYKGNCCRNCGMSVPEMVKRFGAFDRIFEFNHVDPAQKSPEYDNLIRRKLSAEQLDEVDKCVLVCRNCHGILHAQSITGHLEYSLTIDDRVSTQRLAGQFVFDHVENKLTFLTNERVLTIPYLISFDHGDSELIFGTELENDNWLLTKILNLTPSQSLGILSYYEDSTLLSAINDGESIKINMDIRFPAFTIDLCESGPSDQLIWLRHGIGLHKNGDVMQHGVLDFQLASPPTGG